MGFLDRTSVSNVSPSGGEWFFFRGRENNNDDKDKDKDIGSAFITLGQSPEYRSNALGFKLGYY